MKHKEEVLTSIPTHVKLIAVSKKHTKSEIDALAALGCDTFGENHVQELKAKYDPNYHWHMIGHLQRNKVKEVLPLVDMIESVDSIRLVQEIEKQCMKLRQEIDVLIEVNISKEPNKTGIDPDECLSFLTECMNYPHLHIKGLMCVGPLTDDKQQIRTCFIQMKQLYDKAKEILPSINTLSMGMSNDYEIAIDCGSNMIRLGTILFGKRNAI